MRMSTLFVLHFTLLGCGSDEDTKTEKSIAVEDTSKAAQKLHDELLAIVRANDEALEPLQDHYSNYEFNRKIDVDAMSKASVDYSSKTPELLDQLKKIDVPDDPRMQSVSHGVRQFDR